VSDHRQAPSNNGDEDATVQLLHVAGPRHPVPEQRAQRVRAAVRSAWEARTRRRAVRRRTVLVLSAAGAAGLAFAAVLPLLDTNGAFGGDPVALVDRVDGGSRLQRGDPVRAGEWIETGDGSRVALRFNDGASVRLDAASRLRAISRTVVELTRGAVYLDTGDGTDRFEVRAGIAVARDIGTQFEVRLIGGSIRLRVRTGLVQLTASDRSISGRAGTEITLSAAGAESRPIATYGPEWDWTTRVSPPLEMDGLSLASFLDRIAREQGWTIEYRYPAMERDAQGIILRGRVGGLAADEAVDVAITASGLRHRLERGSLVVFPEDAQLPASEGSPR
jgi:ferric-dicitrate binding protein FerR (iron transport regulator)